MAEIMSKTAKVVKPEILSPAGSMDCVIAAVQNGCSSVYAGAWEFSARKNAKNFTLSELEYAVDYCHIRGVKLYVAVNILIKNSEISRFMDVVESIYRIGADGVILQDIGCASLIKKCFPDFYLSASTQMTVHDLNGALFLKSKDFDRIVLSRELSVDEIKGVCKGVNLDIECFIHGAVCVCYSGQCLLSAFNGGRSGNRGDCAQPCRLSFELKGGEKRIQGGILSPKDMMGLHQLPNLVEAGVKSFKIEGRMKSPEYVGGVTAIYRKYLDSFFDNPGSYKVEKRDIERLAAIFNRSGFSNGYFSCYSGKDMMTDIKTGNTGVYVGKTTEFKKGVVSFSAVKELFPGDGIEISGLKTGAYVTKAYKPGETAQIKAQTSFVSNGTALFRTYDKRIMDEIRSTFQGNGSTLNICGRFNAKLGENITFRVSFGEVAAEITAPPPQKALSRSLTIQEAKKQLQKAGSTPFVFVEIEISIDENIFITVAEINRIRREAINELKNKIISSHKRKRKKEDCEPYYEKNVVRSAITADGGLTVLVRSPEQLEAAKKYSFKRLYVDFEADANMIYSIREKGTEVYRCLDRIERDIVSRDETDYIRVGEWDGFLVRTYGQVERVRGMNYIIDYTLNSFNKLSARFWKDESCKTICISPELNAFELREFKSEIPLENVVYGKIPLMTTVQCPIGNFFANKKNEPYCKFKHSGIRFRIANEKEYDLLPVCESCHCLILSAEPIKGQRLTKGYNRIEFTNESFVDVNNIMSSFAKYYS